MSYILLVPLLLVIFALLIDIIIIAFIFIISDYLITGMHNCTLVWLLLSKMALI